jgi:hypothetical protein
VNLKCVFHDNGAGPDAVHQWLSNGRLAAANVFQPRCSVGRPVRC